MLQNIPPMQGNREEQALCKIYKRLDASNQHTLMRFANFLAAQQVDESQSDQAVDLQRVDIPRPKQESVIKAIRRLSATYPMLETDRMFDNISSLMTAHIMTGRSAESVIDELQEMFAQQYAALTNG
jgi:hypothetical protein